MLLWGFFVSAAGWHGWPQELSRQVDEKRARREQEAQERQQAAAALIQSVEAGLRQERAGEAAARLRNVEHRRALQAQMETRSEQLFQKQAGMSDTERRLNRALIARLQPT